MKRRLLFLTFYYPPDLSAGSFRASALINELSRQAGKSWDIDVLTTMPNRYSSFSTEAVSFEKNGPVSVRRIPLSEHQSGMRDQALAFLGFAMQVGKVVLKKRYDAVFATTSRLATGVLGAFIANRSGIPLYLDVRDIFPETIEDVLGNSPARSLLPAIKAAERYAVGSASRVNLVSGGFLPYFRERGFGNNFRVFPNGIDAEFLERDFSENGAYEGKKLLLYAGNIGDSQGLHRIIPELAQRLGNEWMIRILGDGGKRPELEEQLQSLGVVNVERLDPVPRSSLMEHYKQADMLFLHLNDYRAFKRVLPSKIFEYAATGKPVLAGVGGYSAAFLKENVSNAAVFPPCDAAAGLSALNNLRLEHMPRRDFEAKYSRGNIVQNMVSDMMELFARIDSKNGRPIRVI
ncbi:MAG: glycosyltransferase family 4 protein [Desulfobacteraceae bacterium]|nr:glycosyltransferase family 4 protein [Desulfobacteraceae bacterium]